MHCVLRFLVHECSARREWWYQGGRVVVVGWAVSFNEGYLVFTMNTYILCVCVCVATSSERNDNDTHVSHLGWLLPNGVCVVLERDISE